MRTWDSESLRPWGSRFMAKGLRIKASMLKLEGLRMDSGFRVSRAQGYLILGSL